MDDCGDVTIEVWTPRKTPAKPRRWLRLAAAMLLITVGVILLAKKIELVQR